MLGIGKKKQLPTAQRSNYLLRSRAQRSESESLTTPSPFTAYRDPNILLINETSLSDEAPIDILENQ